VTNRLAANRTLVKARESAGQVIDEAKQQVGELWVQAAKSANKEFLHREILNKNN